MRNKNKKGFTLVETLAVIIVLGIIALLTVPIMFDVLLDADSDTYELQVDTVEKAAEDWSLENLDMLPTNGESIEITIDDLKQNLLLEYNFVDPITKELFNPQSKIIITNINEIYTYEAVLFANDDKYISNNGPVITLSSNVSSIITCNVGQSCVVPTATANLSGIEYDVSIQYITEGKEVAEIKTNEAAEYEVVYSSTIFDNKTPYTTYIYKTLIVQ